jgi:hypothetical protein
MLAEPTDAAVAGLEPHSADQDSRNPEAAGDVAQP